MILKYILNRALIGLLILNIGCKDESKVETEVSESKEMDTQVDSLTISESPQAEDQFMLEEDGIKIVLPENYKRYSSVEYQDYLEKNLKSKALKYYTERYRQLRNMDGSFYIYFDPVSESTLTINTTPPLAISKDDAQNLLSMVRSDHSKVEKATGRTYEKLTARFSDISESKIFKAIYKVSGEDLKEPRYAHSYIITTDNKTLYINADTTIEFDFDPYIEKMTF